MPTRIREIIARQADRREFLALFVANRVIPVPHSRFVRAEVADDADESIVAQAVADDLVITHDVPLAARLAEAGVTVLTDRGRRFTREDIRERLSDRDFAMELREAGLLEQRFRGYGKKEVQAFSNAFDRELTARGIVAREVDSGDQNS